MFQVHLIPSSEDILYGETTKTFYKESLEEIDTLLKSEVITQGTRVRIDLSARDIDKYLGRDIPNHSDSGWYRYDPNLQRSVPTDRPVDRVE